MGGYGGDSGTPTSNPTPAPYVANDYCMDQDHILEHGEGKSCADLNDELCSRLGYSLVCPETCARLLTKQTCTCMCGGGRHLCGEGAECVTVWVGLDTCQCADGYEGTYPNCVLITDSPTAEPTMQPTRAPRT